jgi:methyl-accepting chemotaxis protein
VAADVGRLADRVDGIEVPSDLLTRQVDQARGRIEALASALETAVEAGGARQSAIEHSSKALDALLLRLTDVTMFSQVERSAQGFSAAVETSAAKVTEAGRGISEYASSVSAVAIQIAKDAQEVNRARGLIEEDLRQSTEALHKLQGALADVADGLVAKVSAAQAAPSGPPSPWRL